MQCLTDEGKVGFVPVSVFFFHKLFRDSLNLAILIRKRKDDFLVGTSMSNVFQGLRACTYSNTVDTNLHATTGCETIRAGCSDAKRKKRQRKIKKYTYSRTETLGTEESGRGGEVGV